MKKAITTLLGMKEIMDYTGRNRIIVMKWIENDNFPAVKVDGRWESDTDLIDEYRRRRIERLVEPEKNL